MLSSKTTFFLMTHFKNLKINKMLVFTIIFIPLIIISLFYHKIKNFKKKWQSIRFYQLLLTNAIN